MNEPKSLLKKIIESKNSSSPTPQAEKVSAFAYARVSTDRQEERGLSIPAQIKAIEAYARQHGITILATYTDAASAFQDEAKRVEFGRMLARVKADKDVGMILVHEFSRFSRDPWRTPQLIGELQENGVQVVSVTEPTFDVSTVMGLWMQKVTEAKNASYSMEVAFHTRKGMRQNANMRDPESNWCYKNGGRPPWGYRTVRIERTDSRGKPRFKAIWEFNTAEVAGMPTWEWTRKTLLAAAEGSSLDSLRDMLNENGVPAPEGGHWGTSTLRSLLEPHMLLQYAGYGTWNVRKKRRQKWNPPEEWEVVENAHPAIITEEQASAVYSARSRARARYSSKSEQMSYIRSAGSRFLLSGGLFKCGRCGANMAGHDDRKRSGYLCGAAKYRRGLGCGSSVFIEKQLIEDTVWHTVDAFWELLLSDEGERLVGKANEGFKSAWERCGGKAAVQAQASLRRIDQKIENLRGALEEGVSDVAWVNQRLRELSLEREATLKAVGQTTCPPNPPKVNLPTFRKYLRDMRRLLPHATNQEKKALARDFMHNLEFDPVKREVDISVKLPADTLQHMEAAAGVEPACKGFADLCLTTWLRRRLWL